MTALNQLDVKVTAGTSPAGAVPSASSQPTASRNGRLDSWYQVDRCLKNGSRDFIAIALYFLGEIPDSPTSRTIRQSLDAVKTEGFSTPSPLIPRCHAVSLRSCGTIRGGLASIMPARFHSQTHLITSPNPLRQLLAENRGFLEWLTSVPDSACDAALGRLAIAQMRQGATHSERAILQRAGCDIPVSITPRFMNNILRSPSDTC